MSTTASPNAFAKQAVRRPEFRGAAIFVALLLLTLIVQPTVFSAYDVVLRTAALTLLVAVGLTVVIIQGELDLSVGSTVALSGAIIATSDMGVTTATMLALAMGVVIGLANALLVTVVQVNSFIATLATMTALAGLTLVMTDARQLPVKDFQAVVSFGQTYFGGTTARVLLSIAGLVVVAIFLATTRIGREFYAIGGDRTAARNAGIPVRSRVILAFVVSGFTAAAAGAMLTVELGTADPNAGRSALLDAIAACVIGGASLRGGRGTVLGTAIGALILGTLTVLLQFGGVTPNIQQVTVGAVLIAAITLDQSLLRRMRDALPRRKPRMVRA